MGDSIRDPKHPSQRLGRRLSRQLAQVCRDMVPPELIIEQAVAVWLGHADAHLVEDARSPTGYRIDWNRDGRGSTSTPEQVANAVQTLQYMGWGTPVQSIALQAHITRDDDGKTALPPGDFSPAVLDAIAKAMKGLPPGTDELAENQGEHRDHDHDRERDHANQPADTIDAEFTETQGATHDCDKDPSDQ